MWWRRPRNPPVRQRVEDTVASSLSGGDSLPAWNAVWDLVASGDSQAKKDVLDELRDYVAWTASTERAAHAGQFADAIDSSMSSPHRRGAVLPSKEVRQQGYRDQIAAQHQAMEKIGVRPGEGLPMWALYMTRRSKRQWGC